LANRLAHEVLGRSLDELPPQTRRLLELLDAHVSAQARERRIDRGLVRFTRRALRELLGWGDTQLKVHLGRLVDLELVIAHRGEHASFAYELAWTGEGRDGQRFVIGLTNPTDTPEVSATTVVRSGPEPARSGPGRGPVGPPSGDGRDGATNTNGQASTHGDQVEHVNGEYHAVRAVRDELVVVAGAQR
jgi:hypothetical protein